MLGITANTGKFTAWFNDKHPGAYRRIGAEDIEDMTACGLIGCYRYYSTSQDGEIGLPSKKESSFNVGLELKIKGLNHGHKFFHN